MSSRTFRICRPLLSLLLVACASARPMPQLETQSGLQAGIAAFNAGNYAQAEVALAGQSGADANAYLAAARAKQKKYGEVEAPANVALAEAPAHVVAAAALGEALVLLNRLDDAVARLTSVLTADNNVAYAHYWRGQAYSKKKQTDRMIGDFEAFVRLAPDAPEAASVKQLLAALR